MHDLTTYDVCGIPIAAVEGDEAAARIIAAANTPYQVHLCNAYTLSLVGTDAELRSALGRGDLNLADGTPVAWLGRRHGVRRSVRGPGLVTAVAALGVDRQVGHYLYGGAPGVAEDMAARLRSDVPGVAIVGTESPPYRGVTDDELDALAERITASGAGIVWVGLGTPKQDYLVPRIAQRVQAAVVPVGAAFDMLAGRVQEAPSQLHGSGLEWIYRFVQEPRRLAGRYLLGNPRFVRDAVRHRLAKRPAASSAAAREPQLVPSVRTDQESS